MRKNSFVVCFGVLCLLLGLAPASRAETTKCKSLSVLPVNILHPGVYCLASDASTDLASGAAVYINADDVILDLNGHTIDNLDAGDGTIATGIDAYQRHNVTIRNGTVRGFYRGILVGDVAPFTSSSGIVIEGIRTSQSLWIGIALYGRDSIVRGNQVLETGGSSLFGADSSALGILITGPRNRALDNDVISLKSQGTGTSTGISFGLAAQGGMAIGNRITAAGKGIVMLGTAVKYRDNLTMGVTVAYTNGINAGNNN